MPKIRIENEPAFQRGQQDHNQGIEVNPYSQKDDPRNWRLWWVGKSESIAPGGSYRGLGRVSG